MADITRDTTDVVIPACRVQDPDMWFRTNTEDQLRAKAACFQCPLLDACRTYARDVGVPYGVWGGETAREREAFWRDNGGRPRVWVEQLNEVSEELRKYVIRGSAA